MDPRDSSALGDFVAALRRAALRYAVGGSVASSYFGEPRSTHDVDVLIELAPVDVEPLVRELKHDFLVDREHFEDALARGTNLNAIHARTFTRIHVYLARDDVLDRAQLELGIPAPLREGSEEQIQVTSPVVLVLRKLDWFRRGNAISERQWKDVVAILKRQRVQLDRGLLDELAARTGLAHLLHHAIEDAGAA
jgi:hypothetical protein